MGYRIIYRLLVNVPKFSNKHLIRYYHRCFTLKTYRHQLLNVGLENSRPTKFLISTSVKQVDITEYLYLKELIEDERLITECGQNPASADKENVFARLYPNILPAHDSHFETLVQSSTIDEVFQHLQGQNNNEQYVSQAITTLWDLHKAYCNTHELGIVNASENSNNFIQVIIAFATKK